MKSNNILQGLLVFTILICQSCTSKPDNADQLVTINTRLGDIKLILFDDTPKHKQSFLELANNGAYDSTSFYRVMKDFMIQGGDVTIHPEFEKESRRLIPAEMLPEHIHARGMVGAARQANYRNPSQQSSTQFYIVQGRTFSELEISTRIGQLNGALSKFLYDGKHQDLIDEFKILQDSAKTEEMQEKILGLRKQMEEELNMSFENTLLTQAQIEAYTTIGGAPHLDGEYTVFGQVVEGMDTVDKIAALEVDSVDNPIEPVYMKFRVEAISKDSITAKYGIAYPEILATEEEK